MKRFMMALAALASVATTKAPPAPTLPEGVQTAQPAPAGGYPYLVFVPKGYGADTTERWPLVIFLHGSGERGTDIEVVKKNGPPKVIMQHPGSPYFLVSPQLEVGDDGSRWDTAKLDALLAAVRRTYRIDPARIYLTGLSLGGYATWDWAFKHPDLFAAIAPVAANSEDTSHDPCALKDLPIWAFHGDQDDVVDPLKGFAIVHAIDACKGSVRPMMTVYPRMTHGSWEPAYDDPAMWRWLLDQRRAVPAPDPAPTRKAKK
ncbi:MAG: hypothetical protein E7773_03505 [Sphingomonas sp.]|uniref:carboxylesterase family protein n=1 Tax=Sphingomonas sp. TaxID=28214 RepID=UPI001205B94B|nr:PHB depolymerase family esterase [Sphingomonas sp.]THD37488.1 MAG: hypothetical protein E7773_03505 [Sphingomonas sp.]